MKEALRVLGGTAATLAVCAVAVHVVLAPYLAGA